VEVGCGPAWVAVGQSAGLTATKLPAATPPELGFVAAALVDEVVVEGSDPTLAIVEEATLELAAFFWHDLRLSVAFPKARGWAWWRRILAR